MTATRTSSARRSTRPGRRVLAAALLTGAGVVLTPLTAQASATAPAVTAPVAQVAAPTSAAQTAVDTAKAQLGDAYVWGGAGPNTFDCSGLTQFAYKAAGVTLPHSSSAQSKTGTPVARGDLRPGDLVFFYSPVSHVGIYIGNGQMVHAPTSGDVVRVANVDDIGGYNSARRLA